VPSRTGPLTARTAGSTRAAASRGARTRQLRRELLRHSRRVVHRRGAARPAVIHGSSRPASRTSTPLAEGHGSNRCTRPCPPAGSLPLAAVHSLPAEPAAAITAAHRTDDADLDPGRGEWPRAHEPMRCSQRASLSVARRSACRVMLTSVTVQHPRASGIALERCATLASPGWTDGGVVGTAHHELPIRGALHGRGEAGHRSQRKASAAGRPDGERGRRGDRRGD
jgi:hypothetical protein